MYDKYRREQSMASGGTAATGALAPIGQGSLTERTTDALLEAILDNRFVDRRLPTEPELAATLNVSRTTVRAALQSLERLGVITRAPGRGTTVLPHVRRNAIALQRLIGFRALLAEQHHDVRVDQRYWIEDHATPLAAAALGVDEQTAVVKTSKVYVADGHRAIHIRDEIPLANFSADDRAELEAGDTSGMLDSIFSLSRSWPGHEIAHTVVEIGAAVASDDEDFPLDLEPGIAYVVLHETHCAADGEPVAFSRVRIDNRYLQLQVVRHL
jgi:GntR family transcriptional regulator